MNENGRPKAASRTLTESDSTVPAATDNGMQDALLGRDLTVPPTPADALAGAVQADANASAWDRSGAYRCLLLLAASGKPFNGRCVAGQRSRPR